MKVFSELNIGGTRNNQAVKIPVNAYGDGAAVHEEKENALIKPQKKKMRGTRGGRKNREKRLRAHKVQMKKEMSGVTEEFEKKLEIRKTYTLEDLVMIRETYGDQLIPPMVLAPIAKAGVFIFPVEKEPIKDVLVQVEQNDRKLVEGKVPYFVQKNNTLEKSGSVAKEVRIIEEDTERSSPNDSPTPQIELESPKKLDNKKFPMRPPQKTADYTKASSNSLTRESSVETLYSGGHSSGLTYLPSPYYPYYPSGYIVPVYVPFYGYSPPLTRNPSPQLSP